MESGILSSHPDNGMGENMAPFSLHFKPIYNRMVWANLPVILNEVLDAGFFEALAPGPRSAEELAREMGADTAMVMAVLEVLKAIQLVRFDRPRYSLTHNAKAFFLASSPKNQIREIRSFVRSEAPFAQLATRLKNGPPPYNVGMFASREAIRNAEQRTLGGQLQEVVRFISSIPGFQSFRTMCDFAGSAGYYSIGLLKKNTRLRSRVYDRPEVVALAKDMALGRKAADRLEFIGIDIDAGDDFGRSYDLFFVSHFLYHYGASGRLPQFFKRVNRAMNHAGVFVSNHTCSDVEQEDYITQAILELLARTQGYPTLNLEESRLKSALSQAGFGEFRVRPANNGTYLNNMLLSAKKIREV
jgi:hypothetical protein